MKEEILEKETKVKKSQAITFKINKKGLHVNGWLTFLRVCIAPIVRLFYPCRYYGNKNIPNGPVLYVMNHYRMVDPLYPLLTTKEGIHFIAKKETFSMPIFGFFCKKTPPKNQKMGTPILIFQRQVCPGGRHITSCFHRGYFHKIRRLQKVLQRIKIQRIYYNITTKKSQQKKRRFTIKFLQFKFVVFVHSDEELDF